MNLTFETAIAQSEFFTFQCGQWELIWNSELIGRYKEMSPGESYDTFHLKQWTNRKILRNVTRWILHLKLAELRVNSSAFQCGQWELIWHSQLIGRYKEMSPGESYGQLDLVWNSELIERYKEMSPGESYNIPPSLKLP